ncbi:MAG TPA: hypothetical protein VHW25_02940 [Steroidobacteraceae bacterium]|jgi:hypothetical protein|nr:hypothetical protein [Steroidobacteraceae bacterium]
MIWHIFTKDARLLWPIAALVAVLQVCAAIPQHLIDHGIRTTQLAMLADLLPGLALLGIMVMVVVVMQQDPIPGARQDWLIRPIRRRDLAVAKLLFVLLMVLAPLWVVAVGAALADGFALRAAGAAAAARNLQVLCLFALPAMVLGALTRTFVEALIVTIVVFVGFIGIVQFVITGLLGLDQSLGDTGVAWLFFAAFDVLALAGSAAALAILHSGRRTILARLLTGVAVALLISVLSVPWPLAFSMQAALSPQPTASRAITVAFDPQAGRYRAPVGAASTGASTLHVPLRFSDLPEDASVLMDRADIRIMGLDGATLYVGKSTRSFDGRTMSDDRFEVRAGRDDPQVHSVDERIFLPPEVLARLADRPVRMAIDYSLTLFGPAGTYSLPTTSARKLYPGLGRCRTGIDAEGDDVSIGCLSTARQPPCVTAYLEYPPTGLRNPESHFCERDYAPALIAKFWPDAIHRVGGEVRFYDFLGMVRFPVDGSKVAAARLIIKTYDVRDHFTRHVDTPLVRLAELTALAVPPP